jgi:hypothetical protein
MKQFATTFFVASSLVFATAAQAQVTFSIGPKVGETVSKLRIDNSDGHTDHRYGFAAGAQAYLGWGRFALQPALLFAQKGYKYSQEVQYSSSTGGSAPVMGDYTTKLRLNYLTLPINFTFAPSSTATGPKFFAGPYVSMLLGGSYAQELSGMPSLSDPVHIADNSDFTYVYSARRFDAGLQAGLGFRVEHLLLQIDYSLGLRTTVPNFTYQGAPASRVDMHNSSFLFAASYLFDFKH